MPQKCHILPNNPKLFNPDNYAQMNNLMHGNIDSTRPRAFLNYVLFDKNRQVVGSFTGAWQAAGEGTWQPMGTGNNTMTIPVNGYLAVYISNASVQLDEGNSDVWFDHISIKISIGHLREEQHYYPYGLPMSGIGASDFRQNPNRRRYQSNEYIKTMGLNWMSFGARQYDPQLGRFMSVDPLAAAGGQEMMSPYAAMGDEPVRYIDPLGLQKEKGSGKNANDPIVLPVIHITASRLPPWFDVFLNDLAGLNGQWGINSIDHFKHITGGGGGNGAASVQQQHISNREKRQIEQMVQGYDNGPGSSSKTATNYSENGGGGSVSNGSNSNYGLTILKEFSSPKITLLDFGVGDKLTAHTTHTIVVAGEKGYFYNINITVGENSKVNSISVNNFGGKMTLSLSNIGISFGKSIGGYHATFGMSLNHGLHINSIIGHDGGVIDNSLNLHFRPGVVTGAAIAIPVICTQPEVIPVFAPALGF